MTIVGVAAIVLGLLASCIFATILRSALCLLLYLYHLAASFLYWWYSLAQPVDTFGYYEAVPGNFAHVDLGTTLVQWLTASIRIALDASYLDMFMLFHLVGYLGIILLYQLYQRIALNREQPNGQEPSYLLYILLFLPGFHIWTSGIGKDALVFLGILCFMYGTARPQTRIFYLLAGIALCFAIRPHVATLLAGSCVAALILSNNVRLHWRVLLSGGLLASIWLAVPQLKEYLKLEDLSSLGVIEYIGQRQGQTLEGGSGVDMTAYSLPLKVVTFMYRPLFVDTSGVLGLIVSVENLIYILISVLYLPRMLRALFEGELAFFLRFNLVYWLVGTSILASATSNLGLAIRQKLMVAPALIMLALAGYARTRARNQALERTPAAPSPYEAA